MTLKGNYNFHHASASRAAENQGFSAYQSPSKDENRYYEFHKPVLLKEMLENLSPKNGEIYIDGTFGAGGYSAAILESANCKIYAFDRDETVNKFAEPLKKRFPDNFIFVNSPFSQMREKMAELGIAKVDGIVLDLGVSSMQLDCAERGFSFNSDHKLDMRMDIKQGISAFEIVNQMSEVELKEIIKNFGEENRSTQIAKKIVLARQKKEITTALELPNIVRSAYGHKKTGKIDPATKTFQAIRIVVNDELQELRTALTSAKTLLNKNGRLVVVSFHSLEDSYVKSFLRAESGYNRNLSRYNPLLFLEEQKKEASEFILKHGSAIKPSEEELENNIRSRSARLRAAIKVN